MNTPLRRYDFSERVADILGESRRDLRVRVTLLISGGLIPPGPRGPGAPPATADYAADLLIGVMAAPLQVHTVDAVRCYRALLPTRLAAGDGTAGVVLGTDGRQRRRGSPRDPATVRPSFGEAVTRLLALAQADATRDIVARDVFGLWLARAFPVAVIQLANWTDDGRSIISQRYELPPDGGPPAWLDPDRGGSADPGLAHSVFLPVDKLLQIGTLITPSDKRMPPVIDLGQKIASLANVARLARETRHRRPWQSFLSAAAAAEDTAARIDTREAGLVEVFDFGGNPGNLRMLTHVPDDLPAGAALVVVLHGCTQTAASYDRGTGWSTLADRHGFALLLPEQRRANNPLRCFNWFRADDHARDSGEALSIRQMVDRMIAEHGIDPKRVFVTGLSAGGAMTSVLLATYPDVFAGGAILSAVPYKAAVGLQEAFDAIFQGKSLPAEDWAARVRAASPHQGPWPRVQVWHGDADATVKPVNQAEIVKQWTAVHGLAAAPSAEKMVDGHLHRVWRDGEGRDLVETYTIAGMAHGAAIDPYGPDGVGQPQPFIVDAGISSSGHIARSWGLTATRRQPRPADRPSSRADRPQRSAQPAPVIVLPPPSARETGEAPRARVVEPDEIVPPSSDHRDRQQRGDRAGSFGGDGAGAAGLDVSAIITRSFELAGLLEPSPDGAPRKTSNAPLGIDIPGIIATSLEAAGVFKRGRPGQPGPQSGGPRRPAEASPPPAPPAGEAVAPASAGDTTPPASAGEATAPAPDAATAIPPAEPVIDRLDLQTLLTRSFEASGLLKTVTSDQATPVVSEAQPDNDGDGGWRMITESAEDGGRTVLFGQATSGIDRAVGLRTKSVDCRLTLGRRPRLSYSRRLDLRAAVNPFTTAAFCVLIDGEPVDEAAANGMDYAEDAWTRRTDIDLGRFAGRTVTLTFTVEANANLYREVGAQAWVREIVLDEVPSTVEVGHGNVGEVDDPVLSPI
ncbi:MAG: PHB depolymerase family esterase [Rhodospirillales bacterium]